MPHTIEALMLKEHKRLIKFLDNLEKDLNDYEKTKKNFNILKWNLQKHFFVEEKAIFDTFIKISGKETSDTFYLLEDHVKIIEMMKIIEKKLDQKIKPVLNELRIKLQIHKDFEDRDFYPNLDDKLSLEQKKEISKKINEIIRE